MSNSNWGPDSNSPNQQNPGQYPGQYPGQDGSYAPGGAPQGSTPGQDNSQWQPGGNAQGSYGPGSYGPGSYGANSGPSYGNDTGGYGSTPQYAPGGGQSAFADGRLGEYGQANPGFVGDWETSSVPTGADGESDKSYVVTTVLAWLLGTFGADRFYLGKIGTAIAKLVTLGGLGIWALIDFIMTLFGATKDKFGRPLAGYEKYKKTMWIIAAIGVVLGLVFSSITGVVAYNISKNQGDPITDPTGGPPASPSQDPNAGGQPTSQPTSGPNTQAPAGNLGTSGASGEFADWAIDRYGDFAKVEFKGKGNDVVDIPDGITDAIMTIDYTGGKLFQLNSIDKNNTSNYQISASSFGNLKSSELVTIEDKYMGTADRLNISAEGAWTITLEAVATAKPFQESGKGDTLMQYMGQANTYEFTHDGKSNFIVHQLSDSVAYPDLLVNEIGKWDGKADLAQGPSLVTIQADGNWSMKEQ